MASACCRLGGGARQHPLAWWPAHLEDELRDDLLAEAYWKACLRLGRRSVCTAGCEGRSGLLSAAAWRPSAEHLRRMGPALWEDGMWEGAATHRCVFVRELAAHGLDSWASVTNAATRGWLSWPDAQRIYEMPPALRDGYSALIAQLGGPTHAAQVAQWRVQPGDGGDGGLGGVDAAALLASDHAWEVESIVAARRAPECVGGWVYLVRWGGSDDAGERWEDSWEPEAKLELSDEMRADLRGAQRTRRRAATFREWLDLREAGGDRRCVGVRRHCEGGEGVATRGSESNASWAHAWKLFVEYAAEARRGTPRVENLREVPSREGRCGGNWECTRHVQTSYEGELEAYRDEDGETRSRRAMSLAPHATRDRNIPAALRVTLDTIGARLARDAEMKEAGDEDTVLPPNYPQDAIDSVGRGLDLFRGAGLGAAGYDLIRDSALLRDPVIRCFLRSDEIEAGSGGVALPNGRVVRMDRRERRIMHRTSATYVSADSARLAIALHFARHFTHAAAVDGSKAGEKEKQDAGGVARTDAEAAAEAEELRLGACAYGWWEGPKFAAGVVPEMATQAQFESAMAAGFGGGKLPDSWSIADAEVYAMLAYLKRVVAEPGANGAAPSAEELKERRVLVMSDCVPAMQQVEKAWRQEHVEGLRRWDRGAMLEAINDLRSQLGEVVCLWTPAHAGISCNAMADAAAKAHLQAGDDGDMEPVTEVVRAHVRGRPCVYEVRVGEGEDARWELMDRPAFKACRLCARGYVRRRLGETVREGACVAGLQEPLWPEVAAGLGKLPPGYTPYNEDAGAAVARVNSVHKLVFGLRVGEVVGGPTHAAEWARCKRGEGTQGGRHTRSAVWGCMACKRALHERERARELGTVPMSRAEARACAAPAAADIDSSDDDETAAPARHRGTRRRAANLRRQMTADEHAALLARHVQDAREAREGGAPATLQHVFAGRCGGVDPNANRAYLEELCQQLDQLRRGVRGGGPHLLHAAAVAYAGAAAARRGDDMSQAQWTSLQRVMAGILPEWTGTDLKQRSNQQRVVVQQLWKMAGTSVELLQEWKVRSAAGNEWLRQREASKGWLQLVLRAWREEVERHGGRDGRALPQHRRQVHWANDALRAALRNKGTIFCSKLASSTNDTARQVPGAILGGFPHFATREAADEAHRRIRAVATYMRVTKRSRDTERMAKKRRAAVLEAVKVEAKRVAGERRAREIEERRAAERQERADRTAGPAARTREESTRPAGQQVTGGSDGQRGFTAKRKRRGPTHVRARVGRIVVGLLEQVYRVRRGDG